MSKNISLGKKSYEEMLTRVDEIIIKLSGNDIPLDRLVSEVGEAHELIKEMGKRLDETKLKINDLNGEISPA